MHPAERARKITATGGRATIVFGVRQPSGRVRAKVIPNTKMGTIHGEVRAHVKPGASV